MAPWKRFAVSLLVRGVIHHERLHTRVSVVRVELVNSVRGGIRLLDTIVQVGTYFDWTRKRREYVIYLF